MINFSQSNKFLVRLALTILGYGLLAYAASRTLEFVSQTMPPDKQWMGYLYLLATGIGAIIWANTYLHDAKGAKRRGTAFIMAVIDLLAEFLLVYADTMRESSKNGLLVMAPEELRLFILASVLIVGLNALAWFFYKLWDPDKEQQRIAEDLADEIETETLKMLSAPEARRRMIADHAPQVQTAIMKRVTENITARFTEAIPAEGTVFQRNQQTVETPALPHPTQDDAKARAKAEAKALGMWDPTDPNDSPFERSNPELHRQIVADQLAAKEKGSTPSPFPGQPPE